MAVVREAYPKFELANLGFCKNRVQPGGFDDKTCQNTHLDRLIDTGVVDHPVEE
jgi:hypothetical protein